MVSAAVHLLVYRPGPTHQDLLFDGWPTKGSLQNHADHAYHADQLA